MAELFRYAAFISYSSKDAPFARKLHRALESYGIPASLGKFDLIGGGGKKNRIYPVFRDREELSAGQLGDQIEANLKASGALIVICSPAGAASPWVQKEIEFFAALGRHAKIFAIIPDTAPLVDEQGADCTQSCFPPAFRGDALSGDKLEPLAADARKGKDGFRNAWLKIVAGMIGVTPGQIIDRDKRRRRERTIASVAAGLTSALAVALSLAFLDARNWRSDLTSLASTLESAGETANAASVSLAGLPEPGALLLADHRDSETAVLRSAAGLPPVADLGRLTAFRFSPDGSLLWVRAFSGRGFLLDIDAQRVIALTNTFLSSDDGNFVVIDNPEPPSESYESARARASGQEVRSVALLDRGRGDSVTPLGEMESISLSSDGRFFAALPPGGTLAVRDLQNASPTIQLQPGERVSFSPDARYLVANGRTVSLFDLRASSGPVVLGPATGVQFSRTNSQLATLWRRTLQVHSLPSGNVRTFENVASAQMSPDGRLVVLAAYSQSSSDAQWAVHDLVGDAAPLTLGRLSSAQLSSRGAFVVATSDGEAQLWDIRRRRAIRSLGEVTESEFSPRERYLVTDVPGGQSLSEIRFALYDTANPQQQIELGPLSRFYFSSDDRFLALRDPAGEGSLIDLRTAQRIVIGRSKELAFSPDARFLFVLDDSGNGVLHRLSPDISRLRGATLRATICASSANVMRPLPLRDGATGSEMRSLRGRLWNPCDWRGLFSLMPDPGRGDGWFEGPRQWLRLMRVRYFGAPDWRCDETTSEASDAVRARREIMCRQAGEYVAEPAMVSPGQRTP